MAEQAGREGNSGLTNGATNPLTGAMVAQVGFAPIVRVDAARREIELCATSEAIDRHGTVFDYDASKAAFTRWLGNVREMHERRAVGSRVAVRCDDETRKVFVRVRISQGAQDTWEKVLDGTLRGASIGATQVVWQRQRRTVGGRERWLDVATHYELAELSLVDSPSNPDTLGVVFVRAAAPDPALLDALEEPTAAPSLVREGEEVRALGPFSSDKEGYPDMGVPARAEERPTAPTPDSSPAAAGEGNTKNHAGEGNVAPTPAPPPQGEGNAEQLHTAASGLLMACGCALCEAALAALSPAPPPMGEGSLAERDREWREGKTGQSQDARVYEAALTRALAAGWRASVRRIEAMEAAMQAMAMTTNDLAKGVTEAVMDGLAQRLVEALAEQDALEKRMAALEAQPMAGGPAAHAVEKTHALLGGATRGSAIPGAAGLGSATAHGYYAGHADYTGGYEAVSAEEQYRALEALAGKLRDPQAQIAVATELIRLRQGI